jgi:hypothetical protein
VESLSPEIYGFVYLSFISPKIMGQAPPPVEPEHNLHQLLYKALELDVAVAVSVDLILD